MEDIDKPEDIELDAEDKINQQQVSHAYSFLESHGQLSYEHLQTLAGSGNPEDREQLYALADDHDIPYEPDTDLLELAEKIYRAMTEDDNSGMTA
jgi:hypothetical protein